MGNMNYVISGRSSMRRARPLFLRINAWRRREEERESGIRPGRDWGPIIMRREFQGEGKLYFFREKQDLPCTRKSTN